MSNFEGIIRRGLYLPEMEENKQSQGGDLSSTEIRSPSLLPSTSFPPEDDVRINPLYCDWQTVPELRQNKRKRIESPPQDQVKISNRFSFLGEEEDMRADRTSGSLKPPPIFLYGITDVRKLSEALKEAIDSTSFYFKIITKTQLRVNANTPEVYKKIMDFIRSRNLIGHTFTQKDQRPFRIVIRNLHHSTPTEEIQKVLEDSGHTVRGPIINARYGPDKKPTSTFFVNLELRPNNKEVYDIKNIFHTRITIEPPKRKTGLVQCTRCQQYNHTKNNCMRPWRCVKCAENHKTADCPKTDRNTPAVCALCLDKHPANYKGCSVYREILARKNKESKHYTQNLPFRSRPTMQTSNPNPPPPTQETQENVPRSKSGVRTYAQAASSGTEHYHSTQQNEPSNNMEALILKQSQQIENLFRQLGTLMNLLTTLVTKLCK